MTMATPEIAFTFPFNIYKPVIHKTRLLLIGGKEGVGKSTLACVTAYYMSMLGYNTLLLTADPTAHIGIMLGSEIPPRVESVPAVPRLWTMHIDPREATRDYKEKVFSDAKDRFTKSNLTAMAEETEPCTEEMAVFDRFADFVGGSDFDVIVFDTIPTGLTLRLLELSFNYSEQVKVMVDKEESPLTQEQTRKRFDLISRVKDPDTTLFTLVVTPEATQVSEAHRTFLDLREAGIKVGLVVANRLLLPDPKADDFYRNRVEVQSNCLADIARLFPCPVAAMPLLTGEIIGLDLLKQAAELFFIWGADKLRNT